MSTFPMRFRKGMNRAAWFLLLSSLFMAAAVILAAFLGYSQGAGDGGLFTLALIFAVLGFGLFLAVRGIAWTIGGFGDDTGAL